MKTFISYIRPHVHPNNERVFLTVSGSAIDSGTVDGIINYVWDMYQEEKSRNGGERSSKRICATSLRHMVETQVKPHFVDHEFYLYLIQDLPYSLVINVSFCIFIICLFLMILSIL